MKCTLFSNFYLIVNNSIPGFGISIPGFGTSIPGFIYSRKVKNIPFHSVPGFKTSPFFKTEILKPLLYIKSVFFYKRFIYFFFSFY